MQLFQTSISFYFRKRVRMINFLTAFKWANIWYKLLLWRFQAMEYSIKEHKWNMILQIQVFDDLERNNVILKIKMHEIPIILEPSEWAKELGYTKFIRKCIPFWRMARHLLQSRSNSHHFSMTQYIFFFPMSLFRIASMFGHCHLIADWFTH